MIHGETVKVLHPSIAGMDAYNTPIRKWTEESVDNVLVGTPTADDVATSVNPEERSGIARWSSVESNIE